MLRLFLLPMYANTLAKRHSGAVAGADAGEASRASDKPDNYSDILINFMYIIKTFKMLYLQLQKEKSRYRFGSRAEGSC